MKTNSLTLTLLIDNKSYSLSEDGSSCDRDVQHGGESQRTLFMRFLQRTCDCS